MKKTKIKSILLIALCMAIINTASSQISIILNKPLSFNVKVSDIFNATLINSDVTTYKMYLIGTIINTKTGQKVVEGRTGIQNYNPGTRSLTESILSPTYSYGVSSVQQTGILPYGIYELCLKAYTSPDNEERGAGCNDVEVTPLSPPLLLSPENASTISTPYPLLIWLAPTPINTGIRVLYDLKLVQIMPNQTSYDALQRNFAQLELKDISTTSQQYPANAMALEEGKTYAWKILAKTSDGGVIGETEVWTFMYANPGANNKPVSPQTYGIVSKSSDKGYLLISNDTLNFMFNERYNNNVMSFKIYDSKNIEVGETCGIKILKKTGVNIYSIPLSKCDQIQDGFYRLDVLNDKKEIYYLRFKLQHD